MHGIDWKALLYVLSLDNTERMRKERKKVGMTASGV